MRKTRAALRADSFREIGAKTEHHSIPPTAHHQINENIIDSYVHLDDLLTGIPGGEGGGVRIYPNVAALKLQDTAEIADFPSATPVIVDSLNKLFLLTRGSSLTADDTQVINSLTPSHQWIDLLYGLSTGTTGDNIPFKIAVWTTQAGVGTYSLNTLTGTYPDIRTDSIIYLNYGVIRTPTIAYSYAARTVTIPTADIVPGEPLILCYWTGSGFGGGGTGGGGNTIVEADGAEAMIIVTSDTPVAGTTRYKIKADPKVVTNAVNASGNALSEQIMLSNNNTADEIKSSGYAIYTDFPQMDTVTKTPTSPGIAGIRSMDGANYEYICKTDNVWVRRNPASGAIETSW